MSQSTDDLTRSELRAIPGHYRCTTSRGAPLACLVTGNLPVAVDQGYQP
jgi:hypothetical protein